MRLAIPHYERRVSPVFDVAGTSLSQTRDRLDPPDRRLHPAVDEEKCTHCGLCGEICQYSAIVCIGERVLVYPKLCHACGGCVLVWAGPLTAGVPFDKGDRFCRRYDIWIDCHESRMVSDDKVFEDAADRSPWCIRFIDQTHQAELG